MVMSLFERLDYFRTFHLQGAKRQCLMNFLCEINDGYLDLPYVTTLIYRATRIITYYTRGYDSNNHDNPRLWYPWHLHLSLTWHLSWIFIFILMITLITVCVVRYHNSSHAADVTHNVYFFLTQASIRPCITDLGNNLSLLSGLSIRAIRVINVVINMII